MIKADPYTGSAFLFIINNLHYLYIAVCENVENKIISSRIFFINFFCVGLLMAIAEQQL